MASSKRIGMGLPILALAILMLGGILFGATLLTYATLAIVSVFLISRYWANHWSEAVLLRRQIVASETEIGQSLQVGLIIENAQDDKTAWGQILFTVYCYSSHAVNSKQDLVSSNGP